MRRPHQPLPRDLRLPAPPRVAATAPLAGHLGHEAAYLTARHGGGDGAEPGAGRNGAGLPPAHGDRGDRFRSAFGLPPHDAAVSSSSRSLASAKEMVDGSVLQVMHRVRGAMVEKSHVRHWWAP